MTFNQLTCAALALPRAQRAQLAASLLASLDHTETRVTHASWANEADRRLRKHRHGQSTTIPAGIAIAKAREALR